MAMKFTRLNQWTMTTVMLLMVTHILVDINNIQGGAKKNGPSHCKYSENSMTELRRNWRTSVIYSHCTNRFEHHTVAVFSLGGATA